MKGVVTSVVQDAVLVMPVVPVVKHVAVLSMHIFFFNIRTPLLRLYPCLTFRAHLPPTPAIPAPTMPRFTSLNAKSDGFLKNLIASNEYYIQMHDGASEGEHTQEELEKYWARLQTEIEEATAILEGRRARGVRRIKVFKKRNENVSVHCVQLCVCCCCCCCCHSTALLRVVSWDDCLRTGVCLSSTTGGAASCTHIAVRGKNGRGWLYRAPTNPAQQQRECAWWRRRRRGWRCRAADTRRASGLLEGAVRTS